MILRELARKIIQFCYTRHAKRNYGVFQIDHYNREKLSKTSVYGFVLDDLEKEYRNLIYVYDRWKIQELDVVSRPELVAVINESLRVLYVIAEDAHEVRDQVGLSLLEVGNLQNKVKELTSGPQSSDLIPLQAESIKSFLEHTKTISQYLDHVMGRLDLAKYRAIELKASFINSRVTMNYGDNFSPAESNFYEMCKSTGGFIEAVQKIRGETPYGFSALPE
jgi:hypothetical protein